MSASSQAADRILGALGDLLSREAVAARAGSGLRVRAIQERMKPLVEALPELAVQSRSPQVTESISRLRELRRQNVLLMQEALRRICREIHSRTDALDRARRISPAYGARIAVASNLNVCT
jgi:hypothetical protein